MVELVHGTVEKTPKASQNIAQGNGAPHSVSSSHRDLPWAFLRSLWGKRRGTHPPLWRGEKDWKKAQSALHSAEGCVHTCRTSRGSSPNTVRRNRALIRAGVQPSDTVLCFWWMIARWSRDVCLFTWGVAPGCVIWPLWPSHPFGTGSDKNLFISDLLSGSWLIKKV